MKRKTHKKWIALLVLMQLCGTAFSETTDPVINDQSLDNPDPLKAPVRKEPKFVASHFMRRDGKVRVEWSYPQRLAETFESMPSEEDRMAFGIAEMMKQAENGNRYSASKLGYFYLFGIGVPRDFAEAERRFRIGLENGHSSGVWWMARELISGDATTRDAAKAAELIFEALKLGNKRAIHTANRIAYHFAWQSESPDLPKAMEVLDAVIAVDPEQEYALMLGAHVCMDLGDYEGAWEMATHLLDLPDAAAEYRMRARRIRIKVAEHTGKVSELENADIKEPLMYLLGKIPRIAIISGVAAFSVSAVLILSLMVFLTRRCGAAGPGIILTLFWMIMPAIGGGIWIYVPVAATLGSLSMLLAVLLSLNPDLRKSYFSLRPAPFVRRILSMSGAVLGGLGLIYVVNFVYSTVIELIIGRPLDLQWVSVFLRTDSAKEHAMLFFMIAICTPFVEEIAFRGFLLNWFRRRLSWGWSISVVSVIFGLVHGWAMAVPTAMIGMLAGWLRMRFKSLWPAIFLHGLNNAIATAVLWLCN